MKNIKNLSNLKIPIRIQIFNGLGDFYFAGRVYRKNSETILKDSLKNS
jgi:hypothetical protein